MIVVNCFRNCILEDDLQLLMKLHYTPIVVNCFRNCILEDDLQLKAFQGFSAAGCELLS